MVAGGVLAQPIVVFVGGPEFVEAAPILRILVIATAMIFLGNLFTNAVVAVNRQKQMVWMYLLTSIAAVIMYRVTIPLFSYLGAAWSTVAVETLMALLAFLMVWKTSRATPSWLNFIKFVLIKRRHRLILDNHYFAVFLLNKSTTNMVLLILLNSARFCIFLFTV